MFCCGRQAAGRQAWDLLVLPGTCCFLSLCLVKLLLGVPGFPERGFGAKTGEGPGRGAEEGGDHHPSPRPGLHGKVSATSALLEC